MFVLLKQNKFFFHFFTRKFFYSLLTKSFKNKLLYILNLHSSETDLNRKNLKKSLFHKKDYISNFYTKIIGSLIKKGVKSKFINFLNHSLFQISSLLKIYPFKILQIILTCLAPLLETRKVRVKRNFHFVPVPVKKNRQIYLAVK